ncbi:MAG: helix-turn-helix domain-containing protein [Roseovarius sp.]|nr:helix-turn-helix domain-containing protein [Roseovarius sp.]
MIRPGFLSCADRLELEARVRSQREDHGVARRANAILLLDDGESCAQIAKFLYLDDDTIRGWYKTYQRGWLGRAFAPDGWQGRSVPHERRLRKPQLCAWLETRSVDRQWRLGRISRRSLASITPIPVASSFWPDWGLSIESRKGFHALHLPKSRPNSSLCTSDC